MKHFSRSIAMFAAISAIMSNETLSHATRQARVAAMPSYQSRGKGGGKTPRTFSGVARARRAAKKIRNKAA